MAPGEAERIGEILILEGVITQDELQRALLEGGVRGTALAAALEASPHVRRSELAAFLAGAYRIPVLEDLRRVEFAPDAARLVPEELARKHELVPIARIANILCVAKANYFNRAALADLHNVVDGKIKVLQADEGQVRAALDRLYRGRRGELPPPAGTARPAASAAPAARPAEAVPLISMPDGHDSAAVAEEVIEILEAVRVSPQEFAAAERDPRVRLVAEFDDVFKAGRPAAPLRWA
jgi:hypothetical protein